MPADILTFPPIPVSASPALRRIEPDLPAAEPVDNLSDPDSSSPSPVLIRTLPVLEPVPDESVATPLDATPERPD